jgi:hypothetical protein
MARMATTQAPAVDDLRRGVRLVGVLLVALVVVSQLPLPFRMAGIGFGVAAMALAVRSLSRLSRLRRAGGRPRGQVTLSASLGLAGVVTLLLAAEALAYPVAMEHQRCRAGAITRTAQAECDRQQEEAAREHFERLFGSLGLDTTP